MSNFPSHEIDILVIGAGMAGLTAALAVQAAGLRVTVLDKGRGVGGRVATRRLGEAVFDHGAQFFTARDAQFIEMVREWESSGQVVEWCRGFEGNPDGHPRWRGQPGMTAIAKQLAAGLEVRLQQQVTEISSDADHWLVKTKEGELFRARAVVQTAPVPQALAMLDAGGWAPPAELRERLEAITYERCLVAMAVLERPSQLPALGGISLAEGPIAWLGDNQQKGISGLPAVTIQATPAYSLKNWERDRQEVARELIDAAAPWIGREISDFQVHGWRYSRPDKIDDCGCLMVQKAPPLILAGDAFSAPRVEGAVLSGWAAAKKLIEAIPGA